MKKIIHQSPKIGQEISCVMKGIDETLLVNNNKLNKIFIDALKKCNFGILKSINHEFTPHGLTILILLSESHLAIHTYPEHNALYFSLYSCRGPKDSEKTFELVKQKLKPKSFSFMKNNPVSLV